MKEVKSPKKPLIYYYVLVLAILCLFNLIVSPMLMRPQIDEVDYGTFMDMIEEKDVGVVEVTSTEITFTNKDNTQLYQTGAMYDPTLTERLHEAGATFDSVSDQGSPILSFLLSFVLPLAIFIGLGQYMSKKMMEQMGGKNSMSFGMGKSNARVYVQSSDGIRFSDVAGEDEAKENLAEIVDYLHNPKKYTDVGASMPKGVLLVGPPGTGKTMLAKAVAGEAGVPFFSMSGSEFVEMFVGMGASKVRDLFKQAKEKAPCIVFIDEIDAIGQKRNAGSGMGGNDEREQTLNQLLTEMDGFESNNGVIILAATNRPESLDPALTRPGRFDRRVPVELPDLAGREAILKVHARKIKTDGDVDFHTIARMAAGTSGAELANIINEAALQTSSAPVQKITIIPRTSGALGYTMQVETADKNLLTKEELENKIATLTGGRAAEEVVFGQITTGASNDIEQATKLARAMITRYGMNDEFDMVAFETVNNQYLGGDTSLACSAETQQAIDRKVVALVKAQHAKARQLLEEHRAALDRLAQYLYEKETITGEEFMQLLRQTGQTPGQAAAIEGGAAQ